MDADDYLRDGGKLGFIITQSLLKTPGAGQGFRAMLPAGGQPLRVLHVDDMVELNPFEGASNRTAVVVVQKGQKTSYPVLQRVDEEGLGPHPGDWLA